MPEIGEVARVVHYLNKHLKNRTIAAVRVQEDDIVYGKGGTSAAAFKAAIAGKRVIAAKQQGKYFWLEMNKPPHPLMHLGMTGWVKVSSEDTAYYKPRKKQDSDEWPPRFWKFSLECKGQPDCQVAFTDSRRFGRIRLIDVAASEMRKTWPLSENGPDPVVDKGIVTAEWLGEKMKKKRVPIKAMLLDQSVISGIGNWVADEILFNARIHPEQYSNTFSDAQTKQLHAKLIEICTIACETLSDSSKFPEHWLMRHRWKKGKKSSSTLPTGEKIIHLTVGGRTSAVVPSLQKKTGAVAGDVSEDGSELNEESEQEAVDEEEQGDEVKAEDESVKPRTTRRGKRATPKPVTEVPPPTRPKRGRRVKDDDAVKDSATEVEAPPVKRPMRSKR